MSSKLVKVSITVLLICSSMIFGFFMFKIAGRDIVADFVRASLSNLFAFIAFILWLRLGLKKIALTTHFVIGYIPALVTSLTYVYYQSIDSVFTSDDIVAISQSNLEEIYDFFSHYIFNLGSLTTILVVSIWYIFSALILTKLCLLKNKSRAKYHLKAIVVGSFALIFLVGATILNVEARPLKQYRLMVKNLQSSINTFEQIAKDLEKSSTHAATKAQKGELYVLVIGESLSRESMGIYNKSVDNTPFLEQLLQQKRTFVYQNAYSSFVNTVPSITASFSQGNLTTGLTFPYGENLISMAKKAGIKVHWISNQVKNGKSDTPIGAISSLANSSYFTTNYLFDGSYGSQKPDLVLIPKLKECFESLDPNENNLVIVHIMGSHSPYYNRFDDDFKRINLHNSSQIGMLTNQERFDASILGNSDYEDYLTSISYNDLFLSELYKLFKDRKDYQAMLYYSDHGEQIIYSSYADALKADPDSPAGRHNVAQFNFAMTRIPLIINLSEQYKQKYPNSFSALSKHQNSIFTNDNLYDLLLDLMQVQSNSINYTLSPANDSYNRGKAQDVYLLNNNAVGSDPEFIAWQNAHLKEASKLIIKGANSTFKANMTLMRGYRALAFDTLLKDNVLYVKALKDYDQSFLTINDYLKHLSLDQVKQAQVSNNPENTEPHFKFYACIAGKHEAQDKILEQIKAISDYDLSYIVQDIDLYKLLEQAQISSYLYIDDQASLEQALAKKVSNFTLDIDALESRLDLNQLNQLVAQENKDGKYILMFNQLLAQDSDLEQTIEQYLKKLPNIKVQAYMIGSNNAFDSDFSQSFEPLNP